MISGYSMGGLGSFVLPTTYPSDFSEAMPLDGGFDEACTSASGEGTAQFDIAAAVDRTANVRWVPFVISNSYTDELSPIRARLINLDRYESSGDRVILFSTTTPEHITTDLADGFSSQVAALHGTPLATPNPGSIDYTWCPKEVEHGARAWAELRLLAVGALRAPRTVQLDHRPDRRARWGDSRAGRDRATAASVVNPPDAPPMQVSTGSWKTGPTPRAVATLTLALTNVGASRSTPWRQSSAVERPRSPAMAARRLRLTRLLPGTQVQTATTIVRVGSAGTAVISVGAGTGRIAWSPPSGGAVHGRT